MEQTNRKFKEMTHRIFKAYEDEQITSDEFDTVMQWIATEQKPKAVYGGTPEAKEMNEQPHEQILQRIGLTSIIRYKQN